jgi:hypothetical protein
LNLSLEDREQYIRLCQAGHAAATQGRHYDAHFYFRQAVEIYPFGVNVWWWLVQVVETDEDRRVALENVISLDPHHQEAQQRLKELQG